MSYLGMVVYAFNRSTYVRGRQISRVGGLTDLQSKFRTTRTPQSPQRGRRSELSKLEG